jgi:hypothetical protein
MKGIYLTEQAKQEIESKIIELEKEREKEGETMRTISIATIFTYKEILDSATILPVETERSLSNYSNKFL